MKIKKKKINIDNNKEANSNNIFNIKFKTDKQGSALLMAILILSSIIAVSFSVSRMVMTAIETGGVQAQSVMAYYASEAGAERVLYGMRHGSLVIDENASNLFSDATLSNGAQYRVAVRQYSPLKIISVGSFGSTKRSVELSF
ncbi:hypothetical protein K9M50_03535 [Patescibacteria group bacterium]|nr:hypothetical protein [Patescibacteria group bacterium]